MKKIRTVILFPAALCLLLFLSLFAGCTQSQAENTQPPMEETETMAAETTAAAVSDEVLALAKCRAALEDIQSYDSYYVRSENQFYGDIALNDTSTTYYWKCGDDWLKACSIPEDGKSSFAWSFAYLCKDGMYYNTERDGYIDAEGTIHWGESTAAREDAPWYYTFDVPWLYQFDWDAQEVAYISAVNTGAGQSIRVQVLAPYPNDPLTETYTAEFYFDAEDRFERAVVMYGYSDEALGATNNTYSFRVCSTEPEAVAAAIDWYAQNAVS